jgi:hypothetical protein
LTGDGQTKDEKEQREKEQREKEKGKEELEHDRWEEWNRQQILSAQATAHYLESREDGTFGRILFSLGLIIFYVFLVHQAMVDSHDGFASWTEIAEGRPITWYPGAWDALKNGGLYLSPLLIAGLYLLGRAVRTRRRNAYFSRLGYGPGHTPPGPFETFTP